MKEKIVVEVPEGVPVVPVAEAWHVLRVMTKRVRRRQRIIM